MIAYNYFMINKINELLNFCDELINLNQKKKNKLSNYK